MRSAILFGVNVAEDLMAAWTDPTHPQKLESAFRFANLHYGVSDGDGMTLEQIGKSKGVSLTRERVRQIIDISVCAIKNKETPIEAVEVKRLVVMASGFSTPDSTKAPSQHSSRALPFAPVIRLAPVDASPRPYCRSKAWFDALIKLHRAVFIPMRSLLTHPYFSSFEMNYRGAISFLNDAGIRQILYRGDYYLYDGSKSRTEVVQAIQRKNKKLRNEKTLQKMMGMTKTVTLVPRSVQISLKELAKTKKVGLNRLYEQILLEFKSAAPYNQTNKDKKIESAVNKAKNGDPIGKAGPKNLKNKSVPPGALYFMGVTTRLEKRGQHSDAQLGIYIVNEVAKQSREEAKKNKISFMHFIRSAFVWFDLDLSISQKEKISERAKKTSLPSDSTSQKIHVRSRKSALRPKVGQESI